MSFLDDLQAFLRDPVLISAEEEKAYRQRFMAALERREREGAEPAWIESVMNNLGPRLKRFTSELTVALASEGIEQSDHKKLVSLGIDMMLQVEEDANSRVQIALLRRLLSSLQWMLREDPPFWRKHSWADLQAYAQAIRAIKIEESNAHLTPIGRGMLELAGIQAVRWLLHVEVALSTGPADPWRIDRGTIRQLVEQGEKGLQIDCDPRWPPSENINQSALWRFVGFGVLLYDEDFLGNLLIGEIFRCSEDALPIFRELVEQQDSPMGVAVTAMLDDDTRALLPARTTQSTSAEAVMRQVRMTAHELRNALVPVQVALDSVWRSSAWDSQDPDQQELRETIDQGIERVFRFVDESTRIARLAAAPREPFATVPAIDDAIAGLDAGSRIAITRNYPAIEASKPLTLGHRSRFVTAILEILRNAAQIASEMASSPVQVVIDVEIPSGTDVVTITIDDDGPGIPAEKRVTIFQNGITYRPGGSGQGLSLAREVIEKEMSGTITCEQSPRGGARFTIQLATYRGESP